MAKEPWNWDKDDLDHLLGQAESIRLDFKQSRLLDESHDKIAEDLSATVSAFANTEGGTIVIGIAERREGKARVADRLDDGVNRDIWSPERVQQIVEANISPPLTRIRVKAIPLNTDEKKCTYVIHVPQGSTAYQAHDRRYYGRSEYECKPLPDHEIRLRMFRGKAANAVVKVRDWRIEVIPPSEKKDPYGSGFVPSSLRDILVGAESSQRPNLLRHHYNIVVENVGEINISEFKVRLHISPTGRSYLDDRSWDYKDGWPKSIWGPFTYPKDSQPPPMKVNVYPKDQFEVCGDEIVLAEGESFAEMGFILNWTLYLRDSLPIQGQIDLAQAYQESQRQP